MSGAGGGKRGRPAKSYEDHLAEAARVLDVAVRLFRARGASLPSRNQCAQQLGFESEGDALRFVLKRRRGTLADILGDDPVTLLGGPENRTQAALRLHIDHGVSLELAVRLMGKGAQPMDIRNLRREASKRKAERCPQPPNPGVIDEPN